ncbi:MAG: DUF3618 domain-containing protein [Vulcanimicrobiaceae bacterium]
MGEDAATIEQRITQTRQEIGATVAAIEYQADIPARFPEYSQALAAMVAPAASSAATQIGATAVQLAGTAAKHMTDSALTACSNLNVGTESRRRLGFLSLPAALLVGLCIGLWWRRRPA